MNRKEINKSKPWRKAVCVPSPHDAQGLIVSKMETETIKLSSCMQPKNIHSAVHRGQMATGNPVSLARRTSNLTTNMGWPKKRLSQT